MPIHPRHRGLYPFDWRQLSASVRFRRAGGRCERCGRPHGRTVLHLGDGRWWDEKARALPPGRPGEIRLRGAGVAAGYRGDPALSSARFRDGWYGTGDVGTVSALGALRIEGRVDDRMNFGGVKALPLPMEEAALSCPGVADAAAFTVPGPGGLDQPWLALVREGTDDAALGAALQARLPGLPPVRIVDVAAVPRNPNGKVERGRLREAVLARQS